METVFLSYSFREQDRELVKYVEGIIESHGLKSVAGDVAGGNALDPEIEKMIKEADALVAVATPRDAISGTMRFTTHPWVQAELQCARDNRKPTIALRHKDVDLQGMYAANEYIDYDPDLPIPAFVKLARTVGKWMREDGRVIRVLLKPTDAIAKIAARETAKCQYRMVKNGKKEAFREGFLVNEPGAPIAYISGQEGKQFEIRIQWDDEEWTSATESQWLRVQLKKKGA